MSGNSGPQGHQRNPGDIKGKPLNIKGKRQRALEHLIGCSLLLLFVEGELLTGQLAPHRRPVLLLLLSPLRDFSHDQLFCFDLKAQKLVSSCLHKCRCPAGGSCEDGTHHSLPEAPSASGSDPQGVVLGLIPAVATHLEPHRDEGEEQRPPQGGDTAGSYRVLLEVGLLQHHGLGLAESVSGALQVPDAQLYSAPRWRYRQRQRLGGALQVGHPVGHKDVRYRRR